jgi:hypothetical protein
LSIIKFQTLQSTFCFSLRSRIPFIHAPYLPPSILPSAPTTSTEPTNRSEVLSDHTSLIQTSLTNLEEQATEALQGQESEELFDFRPQVDPRDHSLVSPPATIPSEADISATPTRQQSISPESTPITGIWTPPSNNGTADTQSSDPVPTTRNVNPSVHQAIQGQPLPFVTPSIEDQRTFNEPIRCGYCAIVFDRTCDRK